MKNRMATCLIALFFAGACMAEAPLAEHLPSGTLGYLASAGHTKAWDTTAASRLLKEPAVQEALMAIAKGIRSAAPPSEHAKIDRVFGLVDVVLERPAALALLDIGGPNIVSVALLVDLGDQKGAFESELNELLGELKIKIEPAETAGVKHQTLAQAPLPVSFGYREKMFFLHVGGQLEKLLSVKADTSLKSDAGFAKAFTHVDGPGVQFASYVDIARIVSTLRQSIPIPLPEKLTDALGVAKVTRAVSTVRIDDGEFHSRTMLLSPAPHTGLLKVFAGKPISADDLAGLNASAEFAAVAKVSLADLYSEVRSGAKLMDPNYEAAIDGFQAMFQMTTGVSLIGDLLPSLGDTWIISSDSAQGGLLTGTMMTVSLKDPAKFAGVLAKFQALVKARLEGPPAEASDDSAAPRRPRRGPALQSYKVGKSEIHYVTFVGRTPIPVAPAWAVHGDKFYLALWPQVIAAAIDPAGRADSKPLADAAGFKRLRSKMADQPVMLSYTNWPQIVRELYPFALVGWTIVANQRDIPLPLRPDHLPALTALQSYLGPQMDAVSASADGILFESRGSLPVSGPGGALVVGGLGAAVALPPLGRARENARRAVCASHLHQVGMGIQVYRVDKNQFPKDLDALIEQKVITFPLKCPAAQSTRKSDYFYLCPADESKAEVIVACDLAGNHPNGRNVLFTDGHVRWMTDAGFQDELRKPDNAKFAKALKEAEEK